VVQIEASHFLEGLMREAGSTGWPIVSARVWAEAAVEGHER